MRVTMSEQKLNSIIANAVQTALKEVNSRKTESKEKPKSKKAKVTKNETKVLQGKIGNAVKGFKYTFKDGYKSRNKVYGIITQDIINEMEKGVIPWEECGIGFQNYFSGHHYTRINTLLCNLYSKKYPDWSVQYATKKQIEENNGKILNWNPVKIVWGKMREVEVEKPNGEKEIKNVPSVRYYTMHNISNTSLEEKEPSKMTAEKPNEFIKRTIKALGLKLYRGGNIPRYMIDKHAIQLPKDYDGKNAEELYQALFHELIHATGITLKRFSDTLSQKDLESYAFEELVAEIGSAYLCSIVGIKFNVQNTASYVAGWKEFIAKDDRVIINASKLAQKAIDFILDKQAE